MVNECMLTTIDNPYNYFDDFTSWLQFDKEKGYDSCEYLARIAEITEDMTQDEVDREIERAIDEIIFYDPFGIRKKVYRTTNT